MTKFSNWLELRKPYSTSLQRMHDNNMSAFHSFQRDLEQVFHDFYTSFPSNILPSFQKAFNLNHLPAVDIVEDEKNFKIEAEMPGMGEEDIKIHVGEDGITIKGEKTTSKKDQGKTYISKEINYGSSERYIPLPKNLDTDNAKASFKKGMLWIDIPKKAEYSNFSTRELKIEGTQNTKKTST